MLQRLRNLSQESKRKVVFASAGILTFFVFVFWIFNFSGIFVNTLNETATKGASAYGAFEQNVEKVYNTMTKMVPGDISNINNGNTDIQTQTSATTTEDVIK
ncbi:MAG: hypothetical protein V4469_02870 [Patescibacteria group bacterium]